MTKPRGVRKKLWWEMDKGVRLHALCLVQGFIRKVAGIEQRAALEAMVGAVMDDDWKANDQITADDVARMKLDIIDTSGWEPQS